MAILNHILLSSLTMSLLFGGFHILLKNSTYFRLNRIILLGTLLVSILIPSINIELPAYENIQEYQAVVHTFISAQTSPSPLLINPSEIIMQTPSLSIWDILPYIFLLGCLISLIHLVSGHRRIISIIRNARLIKKDKYTLVLSEKQIPPMSYWGYIILSKTIENASRELIITHELAHVKLWHSIDLLLCNIFQVAFWFNPFYYLLVRQLKTNHEYQADKIVINTEIDNTKYQLDLIQLSVGKQQFNLANNFNHCQIKKRIEMMNTNSNNHKWRALLFLPLMAFLIMAFSTQNATNYFVGNYVGYVIQDADKQFTPEDFHIIDSIGVIGFGNMEYYKGKELFDHEYARILINKASRLLIDKQPGKLADIKPFLKKLLYYKYANQKSTHFISISTDSFKDKKSPGPIWIQKDIQTSEKDFQNLLNEIGNAVVEIRDEYSNEIFSKTYMELSSQEQEDMDKLISLKKIIIFPDHMEK